MEKLEARKVELTHLLADAPRDRPDLLPAATAIYARKVDRLAQALDHPADRQEAVEALRGLIEKIVLTPGPGRGEIEAVLFGDLGTILNWIGAQGPTNKNAPGAGLSGVSSSVVAGAGLDPGAVALHKDLCQQNEFGCGTVSAEDLPPAWSG